MSLRRKPGITGWVNRDLLIKSSKRVKELNRAIQRRDRIIKDLLEIVKAAPISEFKMNEVEKLERRATKGFRGGL